MKKTKLLLSSIIILGILLYLPSATRSAHAATGTVCLVASGTSSCPASTPTLTGATGTQLRVSVFIQATDPMNGFDITLLADHTVLLPAAIDVTGSILGTGPTILAECLQGVLITGATCSSTDTIDTLHTAVVAAPGNPLTPPGASGLLFTAIYNITRATSGVPLEFQAGCTPSSVSGTTTCINISNGTPTPVSENAQPATFSTSTNPDFVMSASPNSIAVMPGSSGSALITLTSVNSFAGTVNLVATIGPLGPTVTLSATSVALISGGTGTTTLTISTSSTTPPGSYTATVNGTSGSLAHFVAIGIAVTTPPAPDFTISSSPTTVTVQAGSSATSIITLASVNSFAGTVALTTSVTNTGIVATLSKSSVTLVSGGTGTSILTIATTTSTQAGSYAATVTGTSGALSHLTGVTITVTNNPAPDFALAANPPSLALGAGATGVSTISVTFVNGFSGTVLLSVISSSGLTASINPTSIMASGTATLSVASTIPGSYSATVVGKSGSLSHNVTISVTVSQVGEVCVIDPASTICPPNVLSFAGTSSAQLRVSVFIQSTAPMNGFDITLLADHTIFVPTGVDLTGSILGTSPTILVECLQGVLVTGSVCSTTDTIDTLHLAAVSGAGSGVTPPGASGLLFTAVYNVVTTTSSTPINFQTGCTGTSVRGNVCVTIANGTCCPVPETVPSGPSPTFTISASTISPISRGSQGTSTITLTSIGGFTGTVTLSSSISPNNRHGPSITLSTSTVTLAASGTSTTILTVSTSRNTPIGTYTITLTGTNGSTSVSVTITLTITK